MQAGNISEHFLLMRMNRQPTYCAICNKADGGFNYGASCCNSCKMFFRRAAQHPNFPTHCKNTNPCVGCRFCRYQRCLAAGMVWKDPTPVMRDITPTIKHLAKLDNHRQNVFLNYVAMDNLTLDELIESNSVNYTLKQHGVQLDVFNWATLKHTTSVVFMKSFDFVPLLDSEDLKVYVKQMYKPFMMFCTAMRCYTNRRECAEFPEGLDILPQQLTSQFINCPEVLLKVRCPIVNRLKELNIIYEEFLMVTAIFICNPVSSKLSPNGQTIISRSQKKYASILMQYCLIKYQNSGPSRFSDLLSLFDTINNTAKNLDNVLIQTFGTFQPKRQKVFDDMMKAVLE
ncbi:Protein CBG01193 [Caenorhabditis briggsae]|uniref:Protein CBG01193 n=1 Tax=Caenorhabditis briggsae TaxID=6238 RepID=A8WPT2_CAEBR|nr:Protein CBG01193 [Caenorhabditis briggsae]CAP22489.2 Protein CBG01193 [Caenorhabditis briggsae]